MGAKSDAGGPKNLVTYFKSVYSFANRLDFASQVYPQYVYSWSENTKKE